MQTFTLREIAQAISHTTNRDTAATAALHQQLRGWSQRGLLSHDEREGSAETAAKRFSLKDACRARLLLIFTDFFGSTGDELRRLDAHIRAEEVEPTPDGREIRSGLGAALPAIQAGKLWTLEVTFLIDQADGSHRVSTRLVPRTRVKNPLRDDRLYYLGYTLNAFVEVPATELLTPLMARLAEIRD